MDKTKIVHIHDGSSKFILPSLRHFDNNSFDNIIVVFGNKNKFNPELLSRIELFIDVPMNHLDMNKSINEIVKLCNTANLVILYDLTFTKCLIADKLNPKVKIIWQFYGYELYRKMENKIYSPLTLSVINVALKEKINQYIKQVATNIKYFRQYGATRNQMLKRASKRIDYFWGLSSYEYNWLEKNWGVLPNFLQRPRPKREYVEIDISQKTNSIIIGNNRNPFNNHLDILKVIAPLKNSHNIQYKILFSYGISAKDSKYGKTVMHEASLIKNIEVIDKLLPREEFDKLYHNTSALVINGYRQMAMGNIFQALISKVKVYMNEKNIIYHWLLAEGFIIYSVGSLADDINHNNIRISEEDAIHNIEQYKVMCNKYSADKFHEDIKKIIY